MPCISNKNKSYIKYHSYAFVHENCAADLVSNREITWKSLQAIT